ncbi:EF-P lysine aminoacylase EpmA [Candidatus Viadribacter manganicus]|uniref:Elongation factor P--(R)-beta-lysine ligase n=1 Tax=Candidatus Viadribacter manganicus TaxID=1759059 RepID=A0A1B1AIU1_9PROT|nr:EF-P lysine aminoacylase EpmA [Candidatus Viadribacter manganicus]ANP46473.1 elongation factor P--(R)-beta-lysine ligase [Candidatus Viadribacter manganicus]
MSTPFWDKARHQDRRPFLEARAAIQRAVREWFWARGFTEADPNMLTVSPGAETHIDAFEVGSHYLHTSPEFAMKKLLAAGERKLFFLGKTWRRGETGPLHAPEFTMIEWYRANAPYEEIMDDCVEIVRVAARAAGSAMLTWRERSCDPFTAAERISVRDAFSQLCPISMPADSDAFSAALVQHVEPQLGDGALTLLKEYPISEAALARRSAHDASVAERFELYACGVELANGFGELADPIEQRARLVAAMDEKAKRYGTRWPIDEDFLTALAHMPSSSGVAMGFDRVVMLATGARHINDVLWTPAG